MRLMRGLSVLVQGKYYLKFLVDGNWRLAPQWPTETDEAGATNNVLVID